MSEEKEPRTIEEIEKEFKQVCAEAGHIQFSNKVGEQELHKRNVRISELNDEAGKRKALEQEGKSDEQK